MIRNKILVITQETSRNDYNQNAIINAQRYFISCSFVRKAFFVKKKELFIVKCHPLTVNS